MKLSYDLHIHSCLSPCGDNDMLPSNIVGMAALKGLSKAESQRQIPEILAAVELDDVPKRKIGALSGGMKQRLTLAQAVLGDPEIYPVVENGSLVLGNLMNGAYAVGLGSCWIGSFDPDMATEIIGGMGAGRRSRALGRGALGKKRRKMGCRLRTI